MCFAVFLLFAAPIIPQIKHILAKGTGALSCTEESFRNTHSQSSRVILSSLQFQKPDLQLPKNFLRAQVHPERLYKALLPSDCSKAEAYSATLF